MSTPYDAAMRVIRREVDDMRVVIGEAARHLVELEQLRIAIGDNLRREVGVADEMILPTDAYFTHMRARQARAGRAAADADARLDALRREAGEQYGRLKAIEHAADDYRTETERAEASAEQGRADDAAATRFLRFRAVKRRIARPAGS